jgi:hypothetical protein
MRHFGHANHARTERPDSVNHPLEGKLTGFQRVVLGVAIVAGGVLGLTTAHEYYVWFLKP